MWPYCLREGEISKWAPTSWADTLLTQSTFAEQLEHHYPHFRRCNQDDLGDRRQVERMAREALARGQSVCIDRTNFNPQ